MIWVIKGFASLFKGYKMIFSVRCILLLVPLKLILYLHAYIICMKNMHVKKVPEVNCMTVKQEIRSYIDEIPESKLIALKPLLIVIDMKPIPIALHPSIRYEIFVQKKRRPHLAYRQDRSRLF